MPDLPDSLNYPIWLSRAKGYRIHKASIISTPRTTAASLGIWEKTIDATSDRWAACRRPRVRSFNHLPFAILAGEAKHRARMTGTGGFLFRLSTLLPGSPDEKVSIKLISLETFSRGGR